MAMYTTQVRTICESLAGNKKPQLETAVEDLIQAAVPKIFAAYVPVFDEAYRMPLFSKILRHYYTREIGFETYGLWRLKLNTKLCEIMDYYNQLYKSATLEFNPFYDVDYWTKHEGSDQSDTKEDANATQDSTRDTTNNDTVDGTTHNETDSTDHNSTDTTQTVKNDNTTQTTSESDDSNKTTTTNGKTTKMVKSGSFSEHGTDLTTGTNKDDTTTSNTTTYDTTDKTTYGHVINGTNSSNGSNETSQTTNGNNWQYQQDTPQNSLSGVQNRNYLSGAVNDTVDTTVDTDTTSSASGTTKDTHSGNDTSTKTGTVKDAGTTGVTHTLNTHNDTTKTTIYDAVTDSGTEDSGGTSEVKGKTTGTGTVIDDGTTKTTGHSSSDGTGKVIANGTSKSIRLATGKDILAASSTNNVLRNIQNQNQYITHVAGKMGTGTYSKYLLEYRDTLINIDLMIINELRDLFMLLW